MRSGPAALGWAIQVASWPHAMCMNFVWNAFGAPKVIPAGGYPNAKAGWAHATDRHPGDMNPPAGAPVYFSGSDGHICIATGNGDQVYSTDTRGYGLNGYSTITAIKKAWGRTYYGWAGDIFGQTIAFGAFAGGSTTPVTPDAPTKEPEHETMGRYIQRASDGSQAVIGDLFWNDYGIATRAEIAARTVAKDQRNAAGVAIPEVVSDFEWAISNEEFKNRLGAYRLSLGFTAPTVDSNAIAAAVTAAIRALPLEVITKFSDDQIAELAHATAAATIAEIAS